MRRRRSSVVRSLFPALAFGLLVPVARAQRQPAAEGGLFVLLPVGAQTAGQGEAIVAAQTGSEAVWWNPAGMARSEKREIAVHHAQTIFATGDGITLLIPSDLLGVAALSMHILDFGDLERTVGPGGAIGEIVPRGIVYAATYGTTVGAKVSAGLSYKVLQFRVECRGECGELPPSASTSALDFGVQVEGWQSVPVAFGAAIRNVGLDFQVNDEEQADPLPTRIQAGALWRLGTLLDLSPRLDVSVAGDLVNELRQHSSSLRVGANVGIDRALFLRGGYSFEDTENAGPSIGIGISVRSLRFDLARIVESFSTQAGQAPTFISLRYLF